MTAPELVLQVKYKMEDLEAAERKGVEAGVYKVLDELRDLLNDELELKIPE